MKLSDRVHADLKFVGFIWHTAFTAWSQWTTIQWEKMLCVAARDDLRTDCEN